MVRTVRGHVERYYAEWVDADPSVFGKRGVHVSVSTRRDERQEGYSRPFHLYCIVTDTSVVLSASPQLEGTIQRFSDRIGEDVALCRVKQVLEDLLPAPPGHALKFMHPGSPAPLDCDAVELGRGDLGAYQRFWTTQHGGEPGDWLQGYFHSVVDRRLAFGVFQDDQLVCATDAPGIPYMSDLVVEQGINTLQDYRRRGHARQSAGAMLRSITDQSKVPIWSCGAANTASAALAARLGYVKFADLLTSTLDAP